MTLWVILTILASAMASLVAVFIVRHYEKSGNARTVNPAVHEGQLGDAVKAKQAGVIDSAEAGLPQAEIERRIVAVSSPEATEATTSRPTLQVGAVIAVSSIVALGSVGLYATYGSLQLSTSQSLPLAQTADKQPQSATATQYNSHGSTDDVSAMVKRLEAKLKADPDDADGWRVLGWSYYNMERYQDAVEAYRRSVELRQDSAILKSLYGEALVKAANGKVTAKANDAFEAALALDANDVRARFFAGVAMEQRGDVQRALDAWMALLKIAPDGAEWAMDLREHISLVATKSGLDASNFLAGAKASNIQQLAQANSAPEGPSPRDIKNAEEMSRDDRMAMIRGMVEGLSDRLKESPDDPDGWIRLIRSWVVLQEPDAAGAALTDAMKVFTHNPQTRARIESAAAALGVTPE